ncbi:MULTISPECIES: cytochrome aa3 quinol oxidase subunit IV [unclassified Paenibacillus]|uniref:cytochrome aa3 quinol oxidase subunit IV n=1 Tax=unclassified Paenibacillus TaxID=185978 RepID=UPI001AE3D505|nr:MULTISPECIES: cytochrome aa3 quinol oxidase subunit IV [unclassified Paenibacillus]MBP1154255.1 cytochrome aa3-600 menaquinol oxidase subunit 4 [Paenibacillus sp. PvP091]MBP1170360.1 cytochrome aa3-600 menaquinol oxidase subunit 4 [Paenibacillus sp. PvR098]MBP2441388.1 cytochrome aa3-600 menaquinol oxidase subunit 4 [Paenibacillus sp. PvP052]
MDKKAKGFPLGHVFGFILSLLLTFSAAGVALRTSLPFHTIMWIIGSLAVVQAALQLFMFMHVSEGEDRHTQVINIVYGILMAVIIVLGTIWVMSFGDHMH